VIKSTSIRLENIYCIDATGICANECLVPGSPGCPAFPRLEKLCVCPGRQSLVPGEVQDKKAGCFEGWAANRESCSGSQTNSHTYIPHVPHLRSVRISLDLALISLD